MLDRARKTVLAVINKENRGYLTPSQSDLFFNQAQLEIFEDYFVMYAKWLTKKNQRMSHSSYADIPKNIKEKIDIFSAKANLTFNNTTSMFDYPEDMYYLNSVCYNDSTTNTAVDMEEVDKKKIKYLQNSSLIAPTTECPAYTTYGRSILVFPNSINSDISCDYLRKPKFPKWTYTIVSGNPVHNPSASDFQDLEIHPSDEPKIIIKVLGYLGIHIREADVVKIMNNKDMIDLQKNN